MVPTAAGGTGDEAQRAARAAGDSPPPVKVRIVGGGCAGLAAAWELSRCPGYEIHVYERSFRLGGKGASGRDDNGRIHEHGLHVWLGFYENAFRLMRECYAEVEAKGWGPHAADPAGRLAHGSIDEAFLPEPHIGVGGIDSRDLLNVWSGVMPPAKGLPGEPLDVNSNPFTLANYLLRCLDLIKTLVQSTIAPPSQGFTAAEADAPADVEALVETIARCMRGGALGGMAAMLNMVTLIERWAQRADRSRKRTGQVLKVFRAVATQMRKALSDLVAIDERMRWKTEIVDIVLAIAVGLMAERVIFRRQGLDAINDMDYRAWLARHGATRAALDSRFLSGIYEFVFAYEDGDHRKPAFAAGVALRSALRMFFTYRGAMFWRLRSGMGDTVFAPLYRTLLEPAAPAGAEPRSPVQFHFLHELQQIELAPTDDGRVSVTRLTFAIRGDPERVSSRAPLALDHFGCWPVDERLLNDPQHEGSIEQHLDTRGDALIFAVGVDDFIALLRKPGQHGPDLFGHLPERWRRMAESSRTVATQAAQVWLDADYKSLGWNATASIVTALDLPFDTWADMTHTLASERAWRRASGTSHPERLDQERSVAYFCSVLAQREVASGNQPPETPAVKALMQLLKHDAKAIWPRAFDRPGGVTAVDRVVDPNGPFGETVARNYVQVNAKGSERYALSPPGAIDARISPLDPTFANLCIAGDWTACGLDAGCVEAAVMSGKLAAHGITGGTPSLVSIIGYDHP